MSKATCLILGSCLALQAPLALSDVSVQSEASESSRSLPLFREEHSQELSDGSADEVEASTDVAAPEVARFIYKKTRELLPVPFKGRSVRVAQALIQTANDYQMDPLFLMAVIKQESKFNPEARGSHGEIGLMQLKPSTAMTVARVRGLTDEQASEFVSEALRDPVQNIRMGAAYLARLRVSFRHRSNLYISAYNMGSARVREHLANGVQPREYSSRVMAQYAAQNIELTDSIAAPITLARTELKVFNRTLAL